jgi:hypothetical protein
VTQRTDPADEARADRRVVLVALGVMFALVLSGVAVASLYASTSCRHLRPEVVDTPIVARTGDDARTLVAEAGPGPGGLAAAESLLGPVASAVLLPLAAPLRIGDAPDGTGAVVVTGDGAVLVAASGDVRASATFRRTVTVVGDGASVFALVVGNTLTGQVDALRPLAPGPDGLVPGTCVDTSAVGSPLSFLHDAREGNLVGLRTDEDGSDAVLELRDDVRGRVWAPVIELPRAPAGLQGSRTSGAIGADTVVVARRIARGTEDPAGAVLAFRRSDGAARWALDADALRAALPAALADGPALRLEVAHVAADRVLVVASLDVPADAPLPRPTHGALGALDVPDPDAVTVTLALEDGRVLDVAAGPAPFGRDGAERDALRVALAAAGVPVVDVLATPEGTWVLVGRVLARLGG